MPTYEQMQNRKSGEILTGEALVERLKGRQEVINRDQVTRRNARLKWIVDKTNRENWALDVIQIEKLDTLIELMETSNNLLSKILTNLRLRR